jgi:hypothetical protein
MVLSSFRSQPLMVSRVFDLQRNLETGTLMLHQATITALAFHEQVSTSCHGHISH